MMISPESYYEMNLKGKTEDEIRCEIRDLQNEIEKLKAVIEHPESIGDSMSFSTNASNISVKRRYLERAKQALLETGAVYTLSEAELRSQSFQENIDSIKKISLKFDSFFEGDEYTATLDEEHIRFRHENHLMMVLGDTTDDPMTREDFLCRLRELYIGEWREKYSAEDFGYMVMDGTRWSLDIEYSNGAKPVHYHGSDAYPYNFNSLEELFGIERAEYCEPDDD